MSGSAADVLEFIEAKGITQLPIDAYYGRATKPD